MSENCSNLFISKQLHDFYQISYVFRIGFKAIRSYYYYKLVLSQDYEIIFIISH